MSESEAMYVDALHSKISALERTIEHLEMVLRLNLPKEQDDA